ncbi:MAG: uroporphyrinogen decarboxylase family protein [Planctomycetota bacterium]
MPVAIMIGDETLFPSIAGKAVAGDLYTNGWGAKVKKGQGSYYDGVVEAFIQEKSDLDELKPEPADSDVRFSSFSEMVEREKEKGRYTCAKMGGLYCRSQFVRGEEQLLMDMALDEDFTYDLFSRMADHLESMAYETLKRGDLWDYGLFVYDDMANSKAPMFGPAMFEKYLLPLYKRIISNLKAKGCKHFFFHSDGNILPVFDMLIEAGFAGFNPLEPRCGLDLVELRKKYPDIVFFGGVCNTRILPGGDRDEIKRHLAPLIEVAKDGGIVLGQASVGDDISIDTYDYYYNLVKNG